MTKGGKDDRVTGMIGVARRDVTVVTGVLEVL